MHELPRQKEKNEKKISYELCGPPQNIHEPASGIHEKRKQISKIECESDDFDSLIE